MRIPIQLVERRSGTWRMVVANEHFDISETKVLKQKIRDCIEPEKDLGHSDKHGKSANTDSAAPTAT